MGVAVSVALHLRAAAYRPILAYLLAPRSLVSPLQVPPQLLEKRMRLRFGIHYLVRIFRMLLHKLGARRVRLAQLVNQPPDFYLRLLMLFFFLLLQLPVFLFCIFLSINNPRTHVLPSLFSARS